ncbi:MAG: alpha-ketoacid dehydrogenase subunit beta [SAR202 cluster bacterium]|nr:alpha-ketoacid dehydrogenase subunit beta [Chloroflexota bacterium]MQG22002.1 alpha-ketoacid dehydrogenase subunit beta [SAR202 cluster bacterium]|tara:strand:- start:11597 stop:12625 length:1029 start_codon:yes stop_codon:yes gene_type:complete
MTQKEAIRQISFIQAINEALRQELERDPNVIVMGEDIGGGGEREDFQDAWGGPMRLTKGLVNDFGRDRIRDTPISETGFMGAGVGAAATGLRPVIDLMYVSFFGVCADQITNNAAKMHYMFGGKVTVPMTIMTAIGAGTGNAAQHSETLYSIFTHFPGLKCVVPSNPYNAKGLMTAAIRDNDPVVFFHNRQLMGLRFEDHVPSDQYTVEIGKSEIKQEGDDITLIGIGYTTRVCMEAAQELEIQGFSVEVLDLLSLSPMDNEAILNSVRKTRKVVIVDEDYPRCSIAGDISALIAEEAFDYLDAPPKRVTPPHTSVPYSRSLEPLFVPDKNNVVSAALDTIG